MTQHANPNIPAWVYHPSEAAKIVRSEDDLASHLAEGWSRKPVPRSEQIPPPCPGCEQLRIENARLQSELSGIIAFQMKLPRTVQVVPGEGLPTVQVEATAGEIERLADLTTQPIVHPSLPSDPPEVTTPPLDFSDPKLAADLDAVVDRYVKPNKKSRKTDSAN